MEIFILRNIQVHAESDLDESESSHIVNSLRKKKGDIIEITDGNGNLYEGVILIDHPKRCRVLVDKLIRKIEIEFPYHLHIAIALTKNIDRFEYFVEKAVEIGVHSITPLLCEKSERKVVNVERMQRIAISAMKQSGSLFLPTIHAMEKFRSFVEANSNTAKLVCTCEGERELLAEAIRYNENNIVLIGPEGDFSQKEIDFSLQHHSVAVSLGTKRMRVETAGVYVAAAFNLMHQKG